MKNLTLSLYSTNGVKTTSIAAKVIEQVHYTDEDDYNISQIEISGKNGSYKTTDTNCIIKTVTMHLAG